MIVIGGGLSGLINALLLNRAGLSVVVFEEKSYPFHRVCGEYISNEVIPFLSKHQLFPEELNPSNITHFQLTSVSGRQLNMPLDLGGFGVSRYAYDHWLANKAVAEGVEIRHDRITHFAHHQEVFECTDVNGEHFESRIAIGAFGKRSILDKHLERPFLTKRSPYVGVKYHIQTQGVDEKTIALHNFKEGYCGISKVEGETYNLCYLSHRSNVRKYGSIEGMEAEVLRKNPFLDRIFSNATFLFDKPQVINEISFEKKKPVEDHVLMSGDAAGMIAPLCGNGMAMAIHSAKICSEAVTRFFDDGLSRGELEATYSAQWDQLFAGRLRAGREIQRLFGAPILSEWAVQLGKLSKPFANFLMKQTHGNPF